jgi:hypothetical protein
MGWPLAAGEEELTKNEFSKWLEKNAELLPRDAIIFIHQRGFVKQNSITPDGPAQLSAALSSLVARRFQLQEAGESKHLSNDDFRIIEYALLTSPSCKSIVVLSDPSDPFLSNALQLRSDTTPTSQFLPHRETKTPTVASKSSTDSFPIAFFLITVDRLHNATVQRIVTSWAKGYEKHIYFVSDTASDAIEGSNVRIPNVIDSGCAPNLVEGLWCKNDFIFKYVQQNPQIFSGYKWFSRIDDEALFLVENLILYLQQQDRTQKLLIGEQYCHQLGFPFAAGGPGFIFSRAFVDQFDWNLWTQIPLKHLEFYTDDIVTGYYCSKTPGCSLVHHPGFSNAAAGPSRNTIYNWYLSKSGYVIKSMFLSSYMQKNTSERHKTESGTFRTVQ